MPQKDPKELLLPMQAQFQEQEKQNQTKTQNPKQTQCQSNPKQQKQQSMSWSMSKQLGCTLHWTASSKLPVSNNNKHSHAAKNMFPVKNPQPLLHAVYPYCLLKSIKKISPLDVGLCIILLLAVASGMHLILETVLETRLFQ